MFLAALSSESRAALQELRGDLEQEHDHHDDFEQTNYLTTADDDDMNWETIPTQARTDEVFVNAIQDIIGSQ